MSKESQIEDSMIQQLTELKYIYRPDIIDRKTLELNFKTKFEALNRVRLTENEFFRLREEIITSDVFAASKLLRERQYFQREDGTSLHYTLVNNKDWNSGKDVETLRKGYETFKVDKNGKELAKIAQDHGLQTADLKGFVDNILSRMIFDGDKLTDLLEPLELSWKARRVKELALMEDLVPQLKKIADGREISGLAAYDM